MAEDRFSKADKVKDQIAIINGKIYELLEIARSRGTATEYETDYKNGDENEDENEDSEDEDGYERYKHCKCPCGASKRDDSGDAEDDKPNTVKVNTVKYSEDSEDSDSSEDEDGEPSESESELDNSDLEGWGYTSTEEDD